MTIEEQIAALAAKAEPLRALPDEESEALGLPGIIDDINRLRAEQVRPVGIDGLEDETVKRGRGRPRKDAQ